MKNVINYFMQKQSISGIMKIDKEIILDDCNIKTSDVIKRLEGKESLEDAINTIDNVNEFIVVAVLLAYSDAKRPMKGIGKYTDVRDDALIAIMKKLMNFFYSSSNKKFDVTHEKMCKLWTNRFESIPSLGKYGKAQKIVNMAFKYIYCWCCKKNREKLDLFAKCHLTLDSYTLNWIYEKAVQSGKLSEKNMKKILHKNEKWSNLNEKTYKDIQALANELIGNDKKRINAEFYIWDYEMVAKSIRETLDTIEKYMGYPTIKADMNVTKSNLDEILSSMTKSEFEWLDYSK